MSGYTTELRNKNRGYMNLIVWQKTMNLFDNLALAAAGHPERSEGSQSNFEPHPNLFCVVNQRRRGPSVRAGLALSARLGMTKGAPHRFCNA
jgi:hypothetical protein